MISSKTNQEIISLNIQFNKINNNLKFCYILQAA